MHMVPITQLAEQPIAVVGFGPRTGVDLTAFLLRRGARVQLYDQAAAASLQDNWRRLTDKISEAHRTQLQTQFAVSDFSFLANCKLLITSPGVPLTAPIFTAARHYQVPVVGELEFASWFLSTPMIAVTGTNGKSTTVGLIAQMLQLAGQRVFLGGNYGNALINAVGGEFDYLVVEVSSFQLETIVHFHPHLAVLTNISADHLDRHKNLTAYARIKARLLQNLATQDWVVVNHDNALAYSLAKSYHPRLCGFSAKGQGGSLVTFRRDKAYLTPPMGAAMQLSLQQFALAGTHNRENLLAMLAVGMLLGLTPSQLQAAIDLAQAPPHRLQQVGNFAGVTYINDSKSTTPDSTLCALRAITAPLVLILGGKDKGIDYRSLPLATFSQLRAVVCYGEIADQLALQLQVTVPLLVCHKFDDAFFAAQSLAKAGQTILLSPASASFDQFANFEARGQRFSQLAQGNYA